MPKIERRQLTITAASTDGHTFRGTAVPYGQLSHVLEDRARPYRERFKRGSIKHDASTVLIYGHELGAVPLGRVGSGTLRFGETDAGLQFEADLPEARADIVQALERGDLDGSVSIGFIADADTWNNRTNPAVRTVQAATLVELSIVNRGAYASAKGNLQQ